MTPERWQRVRAVFDSAVSRPESELEAFLREECAGDRELCSEVRRMLDEHARTGIVDHAPGAAAFGAQRTFETGSVISGRYRILRPLGRGGMGEVYEAEDLELKERVALKTLLPEIAADGRMIARFKQEIQLSRKVAHPNVCRVFDLARHPAEGSAADTVFFLTMEFLPGETLAARLRREGRIGAAEALPLLDQIAGALDAAHHAGVIHRDFKPSNVMLADTGAGMRAVITDFGLARRVTALEESTATMSGQLIGTLDYMGPELFTGGEATVASDIYALGLVAYKTITGQLPFESAAPLAAVIRRAGQPVPSARAHVADLDPAWDRALARALDPDPARRFASGREFVQALRGETASVTVKLPAMTRRRTMAVVGVAALVVAGVVGWRAWEHARASPGPEAEAFYQKGADDLHAGAYFAATKALEEAVRLAPRFALAHARLAEALVGLDLSDKASQEMLIARRQDLSALSRLERLQLEAIDLTITREFAAAAAKYEQMAPLAGTGAVEFALDLGRAYERAGKSDRAADSYRRAAEGPRRNPAAWLRLAVVYNRNGNSAKSDEAFTQAEKLYQLTSNLEGLTQVLVERGVAANRRGAWDQGRQYLQKAVSTAHLSGNIQQEVNASLQLANNAYLAGDSSSAERYARDALREAQLNHIEALTVSGLVNLGNAYSRKRDFAGAEKYYLDALASARQENHPRLVSLCLLSLASLHDQTSRYPEAAREAQEALAYYEPNHMVQEMLGALTILGRAERGNGDYAAALKTFRQVLSTAEKIQSRPQMWQALESMGGLAYSMERYPEALEHYRQSLNLSSGPEQTGYAALHLGNAFWRLGRYADARSTFDRAEGPAKEFSVIRLTLISARADMALSQGDSLEARRLLKDALALEPNPAIAAILRGTLGLAELAAGNKIAGIRECEAAAVTAIRSDVAATRLAGQWLLLNARVAQRNREAVAGLLRDLEPAFSTHPESRWRSLALASQLDSGYAVQARQALDELTRLWGNEAAQGYLARPDIRLLIRPLSKGFVANTITR